MMRRMSFNKIFHDIAVPIELHGSLFDFFARKGGDFCVMCVACARLFVYHKLSSKTERMADSPFERDFLL